MRLERLQVLIFSTFENENRERVLTQLVVKVTSLIQKFGRFISLTGRTSRIYNHNILLSYGTSKFDKSKHL